MTEGSLGVAGVHLELRYCMNVWFYTDVWVHIIFFYYIGGFSKICGERVGRFVGQPEGLYKKTFGVRPLIFLKKMPIIR